MKIILVFVFAFACVLSVSATASTCLPIIKNKIKECLTGVNIKNKESMCNMDRCFKEAELMKYLCPDFESLRPVIKGTIEEMKDFYLKNC
ncbi:Uncharacterised protein g7123 [Pycnogonum litorale]